MTQFNRGLQMALERDNRQGLNARGQVGADGNVTSQANGTLPPPANPKYGNPIAPGVYDPKGYSNWPTNPNAQNPGPTTGTGPYDVARPGEVPDSWASYRRDKDGNIIQTSRDKTFGQWFGDFSGFGDAAPLVQWQMDQWQAARDASIQNKQNAVNSIKDREGGGEEAFLNSHIQKILNNPNLIDENQLNNLNNVIVDRRLKSLDGMMQSERDRAAGAGLSSSGISRENLARYVNEAGTDTSQQMQDLRLKLAQASRDSELQALGLGQGMSGLRNDRTNAMANILASTEYQPPDISGLLQLGLSGKNYNAAMKDKSGQAAGIGSLVGAGIGSIFAPGVGTMIGGSIGGAAGGAFG